MLDAPDEAQLLEALNGTRCGFDETLDLTYVEAKPDRIVARVPVAPTLLQPYGLVHGGVYASIVESLGSVGAGVNAALHGKQVVGLENSTTFLKAVRSGTLTGTAKPLTRGRRTQVWEIDIHDDEGRLVATGRLRALNIEPTSV